MSNREDSEFYEDWQNRDPEDAHMDFDEYEQSRSVEEYEDDPCFDDDDDSDDKW